MINSSTDGVGLGTEGGRGEELATAREGNPDPKDSDGFKGEGRNTWGGANVGPGITTSTSSEPAVIGSDVVEPERAFSMSRTPRTDELVYDDTCTDMVTKLAPPMLLIITGSEFGLLILINPTVLPCGALIVTVDEAVTRFDISKMSPSNPILATPYVVPTENLIFVEFVVKIPLPTLFIWPFPLSTNMMKSCPGKIWKGVDTSPSSTVTSP